MKQKKNQLLQETLSKCKQVFIVVALFGLGINLLMLTAPLFMMQVFDRVITSRNTDTLLLLMLIAGVALVTMSSLEAVRTFVLVRLSGWLDRRLGGSALTASILATLKTGEDANIQGLRDLSTFRSFLTGPSIFPILDAPFAPIFLGIMFLLHPLLGIISLIGACLLFSLALLNELVTRKALAQAGQNSIAAMNQADAAARNADVIEAMGMMPNLIDKWNKSHAGSLEFQGKASDRGGIISALSKFMRSVLQIGVSSAGAWLVIAGDMTPGSMIAGSIIMGRALAPVEQAIGSWKGFLGARSAYSRLKAKLNAAPDIDNAMPLPRPSGAIDVEAVSYVHPGSSEPVLRNVSFRINPGETVGLIGPTAAGKSTLARILIGNLTPRSGHSRLDNMNMAEWPANDRGQYVGYLPQDIELFSGTIRENISRMGDGSPEDVIAAADKAGVHDMILRLEKGYETQIGEGGAALSGGQRQRIALARAVYGNPCFLVLDEPNASLDSVGESALMEAMESLRAEGMTIIVIAHRPNILQHVDKILVLRNGMVDDFGFREDVLEKLQTPTRALGAPKWPKPQIVKTKETSSKAEGPAPSQGQRKSSESGRAARIAQLQALKKNTETNLPDTVTAQSNAQVKDKPEQNAQSPEETSNVPSLTDEIRSEIRSLADRPLSEAEIIEIYALYSAGDKDNMLKKLKGVG
ncbi:MAG: type I secretion system permease/ATPase [Sneathiella sp.]|nr:type I secretion system permease/ATPase [Sneathiella sp.]